MSASTWGEWEVGRGGGDAPAAPRPLALDDLAGLRSALEDVDRAIVELLARRVELARRAGEAKRAAGLPTLDPAREAAVVRAATERARERGLPPEEVRELFWRVVGLARKEQQALRAEP